MYTHTHTHTHTPLATLEQPGASISVHIVLALSFIAAHSNTEKQNML